MRALVAVDTPAAAVALVTLNRPEKYNALSSRLIEALREALSGLSNDVRAVVLTGADPAFCAGIDLMDLMAATPGSAGTR